jgi:hypothetical protein
MQPPNNNISIVNEGDTKLHLINVDNNRPKLNKLFQLNNKKRC